MSTFQALAPGLFIKLCNDFEALKALRLTCRELKNMVDVFGTHTLNIKLSMVVVPVTQQQMGHRYVYSGLRETGAALGRYHTRVLVEGSDPNQRRLCIKAEEGVAHVDPGFLHAFMSGYLSAAGVHAALARVATCSLQPVPELVWWCLAPHLTGLQRLKLRFAGATAPLPRAHELGMLPPGTRLHSLTLDGASSATLPARAMQLFIDAAKRQLAGHPIWRLVLIGAELEDAPEPMSALLRTLSAALPRVTTLGVALERQIAPLGELLLSPLQAEHVLPGLEDLEALGPAGGWVQLRDLDDALRSRPRLRSLFAVSVIVTPECLTRQARYSHVAALEPRDCGVGAMLRLSLELLESPGSLGNHEGVRCNEAWGSVALRELAQASSAGCWLLSSTLGTVDVRSGMRPALAALAALLRPLRACGLPMRVDVRYRCGMHAAKLRPSCACAMHACMWGPCAALRGACCTMRAV